MPTKPNRRSWRRLVRRARRRDSRDAGDRQASSTLARRSPCTASGGGWRRPVSRTASQAEPSCTALCVTVQPPSAMPVLPPIDVHNEAVVIGREDVPHGRQRVQGRGPAVERIRPVRSVGRAACQPRQVAPCRPQSVAIPPLGPTSSAVAVGHPASAQGGVSDVPSRERRGGESEAPIPVAMTSVAVATLAAFTVAVRAVGVRNAKPRCFRDAYRTTSSVKGRRQGHGPAARRAPAGGL